MKISVQAVKDAIEVRASRMAEAKKSIENLKKSIATYEAQILADQDATRELKADLKLLEPIT